MPKFVSAETNTTSDQVVSDCRPGHPLSQYHSNDSNDRHDGTSQFFMHQEHTPSVVPDTFFAQPQQQLYPLTTPEHTTFALHPTLESSSATEFWDFSAQNGLGQPTSFLQAGVHHQEQNYQVALPSPTDPSLSYIPSQPTQPYMLTPEQLRLLQAQTNHAPPHLMQTFPYSSPQFAQNVGVGIQPPTPYSFFNQANQQFGVPMWSHHGQQQAVQDSHPVQMTYQAPYYEPELSGSQMSAPSQSSSSRHPSTHHRHQPYPTTRPQRRVVSSEDPALPQPALDEAVDAAIAGVCRFPHPMNPSVPCGCPISSKDDARSHVKDHISAHHIPLGFDNEGRQCFQCPWNNMWAHLPAENVGVMQRNRNITGTCNRICRDKSAFVKHYLTHFPFQVQCPECGQYFARDDALRRHLRVTGKKGKTACPGKRKETQGAEEATGAGVDSRIGSGSSRSPFNDLSGGASGSGSGSNGTSCGSSGEASGSGSGSGTPSGDSSVEASTSGSGNSGTLLADFSAEATGATTSFGDPSAEASGSGSTPLNDASPSQLSNQTSSSVATIAGPSSLNDGNSEINEFLNDMQFAFGDRVEVDEAKAEDTEWDENYDALYAAILNLEEAGWELNLGDEGS